MSRAKRIRKARAARRRARRLDAQIKRAHAFFVEANDRARLRTEINASDLPDATKTVFGFLVDPIGFVAEAAAREVARRSAETSEPEPRCVHCGGQLTAEKVDDFNRYRCLDCGITGALSNELAAKMMASLIGGAKL